jgi:hypothetical protein
VTLKTAIPTLTVAKRVMPVVFSWTVYVTTPGPTPPPEMVSHVALLVGVQLHASEGVTVNVPLVAAEDTETLDGANE